MSVTEPSGPNARASSMLSRVKNLLLTPGAEWDRIAAEPATIRSLYTGWVLWLAATPALAGAVGMLIFARATFTTYGTWVRRAPIGEVVGGAIASYVASLLSVAALAFVIEQLSTNFGARKDRIASFKLAAYSLTAAWVAGVVFVLPNLRSLGQILGLYSAFLLYVGVPRLLGGDPDKRLTFTIVIIAAFIVIGLIATTLVSTFGGFGGLRLG